jgi:hypothetical protein
MSISPKLMFPAVAAALAIAFVAAGCASTTQPAAKVTTAAKATVTSSIANGATLSAPVAWTASIKPAKGQSVVSVAFSVDGTTEWTEQNAPYYFNDDSDFLYPWLLGPGKHVLGLLVTLASGSTVTSTIPVTTLAQPVPADLVGTWDHTVRQGDLTGPSDQTPTGAWTIIVGSNGLILMADPVGNHQDEAFTATSGTVTMAGTVNWLVPEDEQGGFCAPEGVADYAWQRNGSTLTLSTTNDGCPDRKAVLSGTWTLHQSAER